MAEAACLTASAYRPRRARDSSLYRLAETHYETFKQLYDERFAERYGAGRAVVWAEWLAGEVLAPVPHHQGVFTVPKQEAEPSCEPTPGHPETFRTS